MGIGATVPNMRRAHVVVELEVDETAAIAELAGVQHFSVSHHITSTDEQVPPAMRFRLPEPEAQRILDAVRALPNVLSVRIEEIDDYPPDDEPPAGVREPRRPLPPTGRESRSVDEG